MSGCSVRVGVVLSPSECPGGASSAGLGRATPSRCSELAHSVCVCTCDILRRTFAAVLSSHHLVLIVHDVSWMCL